MSLIETPARRAVEITSADALEDAEIGDAAINVPDTSPAYGGFTLGSLKLALPMAALREVVPCGGLLDLPCAAGCVIGGIDLRGRVVPVVDLRVVLGRPLGRINHPSVIVMAHQGHLLGLLADSVTGIFEAAPESFGQAWSADPVPALFLGGARRSDDQSLIGILSPPALAALPGVPMVDDPEPAVRTSSDTADATDAAEAADVARGGRVATTAQMMLMRCGSQMLAIDAMVVHATLSRPVVESSALAVGHCRGTIVWRGRCVPAVDLHALCGFGRLAEERIAQAFVVEQGSGFVAFLIGEVVDVIGAQSQDVVTVPAFALTRPALFAGALPLAALPADVIARTDSGVCQYLVVDAAALLACEETMSLSTLNGSAVEPGAGNARLAAGVAASQAEAAASDAAPHRDMLTYLLASERATPLDQVSEILSYRAMAGNPDPERPLLGFMVGRGRSIPVLCLSRLTGAGQIDEARLTSVLVVESQADWVGFAVPALTSIEKAHWEPRLPAGGQVGIGEHKRQSQPLALFGTGDAQRMLPVIDLRRMVEELRAGRGFQLM